MLNIQKETKKDCELVIKFANQFFFINGFQIKNTNDQCCSEFSSGTGYLYLDCFQEGKKNSVNIKTDQWDYFAEEFLKHL